MIRTNIASGYPFEDEYGYARAVRVGDQVFVSGTTARAPHLDGDAYTQLMDAIATVAAALGTMLLLGLLPLAADQLPRQRELARLIAAVRPELKPATPFYCVDDYEQSIPFYLDRTCTLVRYRGELDFGLTQQPARWVADLPQFAERWRAQSDAVAVIRASALPTLQQMGLPMRVIYTAPTLVAVVR